MSKIIQKDGPDSMRQACGYAVGQLTGHVVLPPAPSLGAPNPHTHNNFPDKQTGFRGTDVLDYINDLFSM